MVEKIIHPEYSFLPINDAALLRLEKSADINKYVQYACLPPDTSETFEGMTMTVSGWGSVNSDGPYQFATKLMVANITAVSNSYCSAVYKKADYTIRDSNICAQADQFTSDTCKNDSGGKYFKRVCFYYIGYLNTVLVSYSNGKIQFIS